MNAAQRFLLILVLAAATLAVPRLFAQETQALETPTPAPGQSQTSPPANTAAPTASDWHFEISPYLWLAGTHGIVGLRGLDAGVRASPGDLLSHLDIGLMGSAEARYKRFLLNGDLVWIRLSDSKAVPFPGVPATSADVRVGELVWTSKVGYRVIDHEKFKAGANLGVRFWHLGQKLSFNPSILGLSLNASQNWADIVVGGHVELPLGHKVTLMALGDVGGWNATAKLDYQFATLAVFKISTRWSVGGGYRYLFVDYRNGGGLYNMTTTGAVVGVIIRVK